MQDKHVFIIKLIKLYVHVFFWVVVREILESSGLIVHPTYDLATLINYMRVIDQEDFVEDVPELL